MPQTSPKQSSEYFLENYDDDDDVEDKIERDHSSNDAADHSSSASPLTSHHWPQTYS